MRRAKHRDGKERFVVVEERLTCMERLFDRSGQAFGGIGDASSRSGTHLFAGGSSKVFHPFATHVAYRLIASCFTQQTKQGNRITDMAQLRRPSNPDSHMTLPTCKRHTIPVQAIRT